MATKEQRKSRGRFLTPPDVVDLCWDVLQFWIPSSELKHFRVVDPAVGDGIFLRSACEAGLIDPLKTMGIELYLGELSSPPNFELFQGDGLLDYPDKGFIPGQFDLVIGNPPYGGEGLRRWERLPDSPSEWENLWSLLTKYRLGTEVTTLAPEFNGLADWARTIAGRRWIGRLARCPVEVLFLQRFLELCRVGGWCAVVLPEGLLANKRVQWLRNWVMTQATIRAIIALPQSAFRGEGASARTCLVILQRKIASNMQVYMSSQDYTKELYSDQEYSNQVKQEVVHEIALKVGTRVSHGQIGETRWDPGFWHPRYRAIEQRLKNADYLGEFIEKITYGPIKPGFRPAPDPNGVFIIGQSQFTEAGLDLSQAVRTVAGSSFDPPRSRVRNGDLLFPRSGVGSLLRFRAGVYEEDKPANVSCFVDLIRLKGIDPYYVWLTLKTNFLREQILRLKNGVGTPNLSFDEIRSLKIPRLDLQGQATWRQLYRAQVAPLQRVRLAQTDPKERERAGLLADELFKELVSALERRLGDIM